MDSMITRSKYKSPNDLFELPTGERNLTKTEENLSTINCTYATKNNKSILDEPFFQHPIGGALTKNPASEYDTTTNLEAYGRSKRKIKQVIRFEPCHYSYELGKKRQLLSGTQGTGFNCPICYNQLSYDAKQCYECNTQCKYSPGVGPLVCRDRASCSTPIDECRINYRKEVLDNPSGNDEKKRKSVQTKARETQRYNANAPRIAPLDVIECEACLKLFPMTYLDGHRLKSHKLSTSEYGCPYCSTTFTTRNLRLNHIHHKHAGQVSSVDKTLYNLTRCYLYICCECQEPLHYTELQCHLQHQHSNMDIFQCLNRIKTICPFCNIHSFHMIDDLLSHVKAEHPGARIIGKRLRIGSTTILSTSNPRILPRSVSIPYESTTSPVYPESFVKLSTSKLIQGINLGINTRKRSFELDTLIETIDKFLRQAENSLQIKITKVGLVIVVPGDNDEQEFISECKLFLKSVRDRSQKAEREALEKMKFKDNWEETQRKLVYEYRTTKKMKKSAFDVELEELIYRPIMMGNDNLDMISSGTNHQCEVCSSLIMHYDGLSNSKLTPGYTMKSIDSVDSDDSSVVSGSRPTPVSIPTAFERNHEHRNRRYSNKFRQKMDMLRLLEVKNGLSFIKTYNEGLITDKR